MRPKRLAKLRFVRHQQKEPGAANLVWAQRFCHFGRHQASFSHIGRPASIAHLSSSAHGPAELPKSAGYAEHRLLAPRRPKSKLHEAPEDPAHAAGAGGQVVVQLAGSSQGASRHAAVAGRLVQAKSLIRFTYSTARSREAGSAFISPSSRSCSVAASSVHRELQLTRANRRSERPHASQLRKRMERSASARTAVGASLPPQPLLRRKRA